MSAEQPPLSGFDPTSMDHVQQVEALPHSRAFEHAIYENRLVRAAIYHYASEKDSNDDIDPIQISPQLLHTTFPTQLRDIFPLNEYTISYLEITQNDAPSEQTIDISFYANDTPHVITLTQEHIEEAVFTSVKYGTENSSNEKVLYGDIEPEAIVGLIAAFVYAKQYDNDSGRPMEIDDSNIVTPRPENTDLVERMIMTLGEFSGQSTVKTAAVFDSSLMVTHSESERSTISGIDSTINITELNPSATINADVVQKLVNLKQGTPLVPAGTTDLKYAEITSTPRSVGLEITEHIDPKNNFGRWAYLCGKLLDAISQPMEKYRSLDDFIPLESL